MTLTLDEQDRRTLLHAAREAVRAAASGAEIKINPPPALSDALMAPCGVFVTLTKHGNLRGCVGFVEPEKPLYATVILAAQAAAVSDTRFAPVSPDELDDLSIEISVLTPPVPVSGPKEIELGKHGIILSKHGRRALFLPSVATSRGWDIETTLSHLALKAGLSPDDWREGARFEVFEAIVVKEDDECS